ncbi:MAG: hypothetical protein IH968_01970, partial [Gemmatimonadetes bacterium]|nr:hypothetical protein [Gemmatimonadota bacterium]
MDGGPFGYGAGVCFYISTTPDPTGGWFVYDFFFSGVVDHDYPKWGIWPDAYFLTVNDPSGFGSHVIFFIDRVLALGGTFSGFVITGGFPSPHLGFGFQGGLAPADLDGLTPPVVDAPGHFVRHWDDEVHGMHPLTGGVDATMDFLDIFEVVTGFGVPAFAVTESLVLVAEFDSTLCGGAGCVPQPAPGVLLDTLREPVMHRLQYRNFGTHETLVGNFTVDVTGTDQAGIRWFELRRTPPGAGSWTLFQEG